MRLVVQCLPGELKHTDKAGHTCFPYKMQLYLTSCLHSNYYTCICLNSISIHSSIHMERKYIEKAKALTEYSDVFFGEQNDGKKKEESLPPL